MFLYYDRIYHIRRLVEKAQAEELFDAEQAEKIWGEREKVRWIKGLLNRLNRRGMRDTAIADYLGISHQSVSHWRSGKNSPSREREGQLMELGAETEKAGGETNFLTNSRLTNAPIEAEKMPVPISIIKDNTPMTDTPASFGQCAEDGPGCEKCPLKGRPRVGGRGGVKL